MPSDPAQARDGLPLARRPADAPPRDPSIRARLKAVLGELGPTLQPGHALKIAEQNRGPVLRHSSGLPALDRLLGGGFARGQLSEIVGPPSSGRTSLLLALLAQTTSGSGELAAVVDRADAFDPLSAEVAGVDLARVLWVRVGKGREALRSTEHLLETEGLPLVLLDLDPPGAHGPGPAPSRPVSVPAWTRLARLAAGTGSALVVLSRERQVGHLARMVLELQPAGSHFHGSPPLLTKFESRAVLLRHSQGTLGRSIRILLGGRSPGP
ncbi:MAG: hypothetical protein VCC04_10160 [Myxococcota bacterium]